VEQHAELVLAVDSRIECISSVGEAVKSVCSLFNFSDQQIYEVQLCVVEATSNAVRHAYGNKSGNLVEIKLAISSTHVSVQVYDWGSAMPPETLEQAPHLPSKTENRSVSLLPESGWGLLILTKLMDRVEYTSRDGRNCLSMNKTIPSLQDIPQ
jgi:serine/threonine-protein kinase RsbW